MTKLSLFKASNNVWGEPIPDSLIVISAGYLGSVIRQVQVMHFSNSISPRKYNEKI